MTENQPSAAPETFAPRSPFAFLMTGLPGGFSGAGIQFLLGWLAFQVLTSLAWAVHLRALAGSSSMPTYWGEFLTSRDIWEMLQHGGLRNHPLGAWVTLAGVVSMFWLLWFGWRMQAASAGVRPGLIPWLRGFAEALLLMALPFWLVRTAGLWVLGGLASTGIQGLGWLNLVGGVLLHIVLGSAFMVQWWLCRLDLVRPASAPNAIEGFRRHLVNSFLRLWIHPVQWGGLLVFGALFRAGLFLLSLWLAWRWGGGSAFRVAMVGVMLGAATLLNAWIVGWTMRLTSHYWRHDRRVRDEIQALKQLTQV